MAASNESLYGFFNDKGFCWTLVAVFGAKLVVGLVGSIQSACNCLLAFNALFNLCYQTNHIIPFWISLTGRNFISLPLCFYLQLYGIFAVHCNLGISLSIGVDRLLCVSLPTWQNKKVSMYLSTIVGLSSCYAVYILVLCFQMTLRLPNLAVLCSASDCYQSELSVTVSRNAIIFVVLNIGCYAVVWVLLFTAAVKRDAVKDMMTIKIFKSLTIIMLMEIFGCLSNWVARLFIIPKMDLSALPHLYVTSLLSMAANSAMATNPIILYHFSAEYHRIFDKQYYAIFGKRKISARKSIISIHLTNSKKPANLSRKHEQHFEKRVERLGRQYSYEHTVQLGGTALTSLQTKKITQISWNYPQESVRFNEHDPREDWKEERRANTWTMQLKRWISSCRAVFSWNSLRMLLIDWLFLAILGIGMALTSMFMDTVIEYLQTFQLVLMSKSGQTGSTYLDYICTYLSWLGYTELLVVCSAMIVHYLAPQAIVQLVFWNPRDENYLRGVVLKDFLTLRTLISKVVGLTFSLGSGIPIGKMGPFVHVASIAANLLSNIAATVDGAYGNECRKSEMLAAACATGVACTFSAPIGGVLFSIEVTTMYFSVRNYWRGFFAAACGATVFRLLRVIVFKAEVTLVAFYQTHFPQDAFEPEELPFFALIGLLSGLLGAGFIVFYQSVVMFLRQNPLAKRFFQRNWIVYPVVVAFLVATITYPRGYGRFLSGRYKFTQTVVDLFSNCTWSKPMYSVDSPHGCSSELLATWTNHEGYGPYNVFLVLCLFAVTFLFLSALCNTMPIPCGMFMPMFVVGAAFGRLIGEIVSIIFPDGIPGGTDQPIFPGIYAVVGAAALTGAITHSVSVAMICCEITGQLIYIIPLMIAVIIANAVCTYLQPSVYDVMIRIKHLPYLPDLPPSNAAVHMFTAEHIMVSPVRYLCRLTSYADIRNVLVDMPKLRSFPVVDDPSSMMLLGSVPRRTLLELLSKQIGDEARKKEAERRIRSAIETIDRHFREAQDQQMQQSPSSGNEKDKGSTESLTKRSISSWEDVPMPREQDTYTEQPPFRKTSINLPAESLTVAAKKVSVVEPYIHRTHSESALASKLKRKLKNNRNESRPRKRNRFLVEPVHHAYNNYFKKIGKNISSHKNKDGGRPRARRNAVSSSVSVQGKMNDDDEDVSRSNSGTSTPARKHSWSDSKVWNNHHDHQASITKNITDYVKQAKRRLLFMQTRHKESVEKVEYDLFDEERRQWELAQLEEVVEFDEKQIDPAPFNWFAKHQSTKDLRIAIQNSQNGVPLKREDTSSSELNSSEQQSTAESTFPNGTPTFSIEGSANLDVESGGEWARGASPINISVEQWSSPINTRTSSPNPGDEVSNMQVSPGFHEILERKRNESSGCEEVHDVLTPTLKIVHASSASLHHFVNHPMLTIQEENEPIGISRKSSLKSLRNSSLRRTDAALVVAAAIAPIQPPQFLNLESIEAGTSDQLGMEALTPEPGDVAMAVAYLRRKSLALEDLMSLEETPLPDQSFEQR
uniref:Chloride channel protein n=1 Tax=Ditylenchus dipsaci TaxID=166011 RepID=A0A915DCL2_9BILA